MDSRVKLGLWSGVGIVVANMIGSGVLTTPGFMAMDLAPSQILLAWLAGGVLALCGARAYAAAAEAIPRSGGEYRYLSELWHPALGYLAGWTSLLVGFSQPVALDAIAIGAFADTLVPGLDVRTVATATVIAVTALHAIDLRASKVGQNALVAVKIALVLGFMAVGLAAGNNHFPTWVPDAAKGGLPVAAFFGSLVFIMFCYSGWNAAIYASEEFAAPRRDVPRAMLIGCATVMLLYLVVNWVFVANLTPAHFSEWIRGDRDRITLGHVLMRDLIGAGGANIMSVVVIVALVSATSAMTMIGPRVYAAMARDGFLPRVFAGADGKPPLGALLLQSAVAIFCVWTQTFRGLLGTVGAILTLMAALTALGVIRMRFDARFASGRPSGTALAAAAVFAGGAAWMLYFAFTSPLLNTAEVPGVGKVPAPLVWLVFIVLVTVVYTTWSKAMSATKIASGTRAAE
jgi:APA family basic amino acid/polyamine antiporter